jgi:hypothetical protein
LATFGDFIMVYNSDDIKHLSVMAELETKEQKVVTEVAVEDHIPTSFDEKLLTLCESLRQHGFDNYAEKLETKIALVKQADVHLYRAHDEDGEDVVDSAHPDGDAHMADAQDKNGDVETILSQHKKIVDIISKMPTGKLASYIDQCKTALGIKKKAQQNNQEKAVPYVNDAANKIDKAIATFFANSKTGIAAKKKIIELQGNIKSNLINPSATGLIEAQENIKSLVSLLMGSIEGFASRFSQSLGWKDIAIPHLFLTKNFFDTFWSGSQVDTKVLNGVILQINKASQIISAAQNIFSKDAIKSMQDQSQTNAVQPDKEKQSGDIIETNKIVQYLNAVKTNVSNLLIQIGAKSKTDESLGVLVLPVKTFLKELDALISGASAYSSENVYTNINDISELTNTVPDFSAIKTFAELQSKLNGFSEKLQKRLDTGV